MYKKMDAGERAAKLAELARQLGILEALADGPLLVEGAGGPTTADAAIFPTLCFCRSVRASARVRARRRGAWEPVDAAVKAAARGAGRALCVGRASA
jgi:hypothetical protein